MRIYTRVETRTWRHPRLQASHILAPARPPVLIILTRLPGSRRGVRNGPGDFFLPDFRGLGRPGARSADHTGVWRSQIRTHHRHKEDNHLCCLTKTG